MREKEAGFVNDYRPGRIAFTCLKCGKKIWLELKIVEIYKSNGMCLDCKNTRK